MEDKATLKKKFREGDRAKRLQIWNYALANSIEWEKLLFELQMIEKKDRRLFNKKVL